MIPIVYINSRSVPFVSLIMQRIKIYETRTRNMLNSIVGMRVLIAETGNGNPVIRCSARIASVFPVRSSAEWESLARSHCVPVGSEYDWKPTTKIKWLYTLTDVQPVPAFPIPDGRIPHGRSWAELPDSLYPFPFSSSFRS